MPATQSNVRFFISYRRTDVPNHVVRIRDILADRFGEDNVYFDAMLEAGSEYPPVLEQKIRAAQALVVVIGKEWERGVDGTRDINDPSDWVHREIAIALEMSMDILPIYVDRKDAPTLPVDLDAFGRRTAMQLRSTRLKKRDSLAMLYRALDTLADKHKRKPLVFISSTLTYLGSNSSLDGLDYFTSLLTTVLTTVNALDQDVVLKVPEFASNFSTAAITDHQTKMLDEVLANAHLYKGLVIAPYEVNPVLRRIREFRRATGARQTGMRETPTPFPIAAIDKGFADFIAPVDSQALAPLFSVENDGEANGALAAECVMEYLEMLPPQPFNVVVMVGQEGSAPRVAGFSRGVDEWNSRRASADKLALDVRVEQTTPMKFTQEDGLLTATYVIKPAWIKAKFHQRPPQIHAFFCCNDEIALGTRLALMDGAATIRKWPEPVAIVGFDGIRDVTRLLEAPGRERHLLNTVNTKIYDQASSVVRLLFNWMERAVGAPATSFTKLIGERCLTQPQQHMRAEHIIRSHRRPRPGGKKPDAPPPESALPQRI